jgi:hypothetical protein
MVAIAGVELLHGVGLAQVPAWRGRIVSENFTGRRRSLPIRIGMRMSSMCYADGTGLAL